MRTSCWLPLFLLIRRANISAFPAFLPGVGGAAHTIRAVSETHPTKPPSPQRLRPPRCALPASGRGGEKQRYLFAGLIVSTLAISGCDSDSAPQRAVATLSGADVTRSADPAVLEKGRRVFGQHCASCHGAQAEGAANWRSKQADGKSPPPPLNGSGHDWHHPKQELHDFIKNGSPPGTGDMPAWKGKLSDEDIDAVIVWFQSLWPDEVYAAWVDRHAIR